MQSFALRIYLYCRCRTFRYQLPSKTGHPDSCCRQLGIRKAKAYVFRLLITKRLEDPPTQHFALTFIQLAVSVTGWMFGRERTLDHSLILVFMLFRTGFLDPDRTPLILTRAARSYTPRVCNISQMGLQLQLMFG